MSSTVPYGRPNPHRPPVGCDSHPESDAGHKARIDTIIGGKREFVQHVGEWFDARDAVELAKFFARQQVVFYEKYDVIVNRIVVDLATGEDVFTAELHPSRQMAVERRRQQRYGLSRKHAAMYAFFQECMYHSH